MVAQAGPHGSDTRMCTRLRHRVRNFPIPLLKWQEFA